MFSRLVPLLRPVKHRVALVVALELALVTTIFLRPWFIQRAIDRGFIQGADGLHVDVALVATMVAGLALSWAFRFGLAGFSQYVAGGTAISILNELRRRVFAHVQTLSVRYFDRTKAGRIVSRADRDVDTLEPLLIQGPPELLSALLRCVVLGACCSTPSRRTCSSAWSASCRSSPLRLALPSHRSARNWGARRRGAAAASPRTSSRR